MEMTSQATGVLAGYPLLSNRTSTEQLQASFESSDPNPPDMLVYALWLAGSTSGGAGVARGYLDTFELMLNLFERGIMTGAWRSRIRKLMPRKGPATLERFR